MNLFKRLYKQNQQRKFDALREKLDEFTTKHVEERNRQPTGNTADVLE